MNHPTSSLPREITDELLQLIPGYDPAATAGDCTFDERKALHAINFFPSCLHHVKGHLGGKPFQLEPWQQCVIANLFGWIRPDGTRRYRESFIMVPRKNGKTAMCAGLVNYVLFCDDEPGAELYCAAGEKEQAALVYDQTRGMIERSHAMRSRCKIYTALKSVVREETASVFKTLSADAKTKHGFNSHLVVVDELHVQRDAELFDTLETSMGSRRQPLLLSITTSDYERVSLCNTKYDYAAKVRDGILDDPAFLPVIFEADRKDDWTDEATWYKANPNLGVSISIEYMRAKCKKAQEEPSYENTFKRLHLNLRTEQDIRWIPMSKWDECGEAFDVAELARRPCYAGLDLASTTDLTTLQLYFPDSNRVLSWFWVPEEKAVEREKRDRVPYITWKNQGFVEMTPGNVTDYRYIRRRINEISKLYEIRGIGYDPYNATHLALELQDEDGVPMIEFRQGYVSMNEPCKILEALVISGALRHGGNPVLRWNASNVVAKIDPAGNIKIDKSKSAEKVDGMVALAMAIGLSSTAERNHGSVYDERGIATL